jgi:hypothetical protein
MIRRGSRRVEIEDETEVGGQRLPLEIKTNAALDAGGALLVLHSGLAGTLRNREV